MSRVTKAVRMQYANATTFFWVPALVALAATLIVVLIGAIIPHEGQPILTGAANSPFWFFAVAGVQGVTRVFPFALAIGLSRWEFSVSTLLAALGAGGLLALLVTLLGLLEEVTRGWFVEAYVFYLPWFWYQGGFVTWLLFTAIAVVLFQLGFALTVLYKRYGMLPMVAIMVLFALLLVVPVWVITASSLWPQTLNFFASLTPLAVTLWTLFFSLVIAALGYLVIRRYEVR